jgi:NADH:ubiquinone oxidoreductase subunit 5 (subunit L)/multisubunit Na+/H+ antiporter MnhA subunit
MPFTAAAFLCCAFSVMGVPPFGGFFSKYMVFAGALKSGEFLITFVFLIGAVLTILYLLRVFNMVFLGQPQQSPAAKEGSSIMVSSVVMLAVLSFAGGILIKYPFDLAQVIVRQMLGQ